jgi:hypothetical protein
VKRLPGLVQQQRWMNIYEQQEEEWQHTAAIRVSGVGKKTMGRS